MLYYINLLRALAWWARVLADARYRENYWAAVAANQTWYAILHDLIEPQQDPDGTPPRPLPGSRRTYPRR